ncbi:MAG: RNA methyltransferase [Bdellovibrionaceae bacterium]|nr:RNA methyltransferase [Pseudobdellovibrionaceae bacterium]
MSLKEPLCFVSTPLGFESEAEREIKEAWPELLDASGRPHSAMLPEGEWTKGGIEYPLDPFTAVQLNFFLKTANRILIRLDRFKVRDFPKLHERLRKIDLKSWIGSAPIRFEVSAAKSRLGHEGRIRETAAKAWGIPQSDTGVRVFIRIQDDLCDVSLDSSGEHLHKRGVHTLRGEAPLRENIAAFCLRRLIGDSAPGELSKITLLDPMCGSGTFLSEAATLWSPLFKRHFAFQDFGRLPKLFKQPQFATNYRMTPAIPFRRFIGFDLEAKMAEVSRKNLSEVSLHPSSAAKPSFEVHQGDLFSEGTEKIEGKLWVISNPPYGERIEGPPLDQVLKQILRKWNPDRVALLVPAKVSSLLKAATPARLIEEKPVLNGGIDCRLMIWETAVLA